MTQNPLSMEKHGKNMRNSSVELLKLLACVIIIFSHSFPRGSAADTVPYLIDPSQATANIQYFGIIVVKYLGQVGNAIFIVSSAYFLLRSHTVKTDKVLDIIRDSFLISVLFLFAMLMAGFRFPVSTMVKQFIPITMNTNWFVGCYALYYLIHPAINTAIRSLSQKQHLSVCLLIFVFYYGINCLMQGRYYYTQLIGFINIHLLISYMDLYLPRFSSSKKQNLCGLIVSLLLLFVLILAVNILGLRIGALSNKADWFSNISNPLIIAVGICSFNLARAVRFENRSINYFSKLTLLIYITHANDLVMDYLKPAFFEWVYRVHSYDHILAWCFFFGVCLMAGGVLLSILYHELTTKLLGSFWPQCYCAVFARWDALLSFLMSRS